MVQGLESKAKLSNVEADRYMAMILERTSKTSKIFKGDLQQPIGVKGKIKHLFSGYLTCLALEDDFNEIILMYKKTKVESDSSNDFEKNLKKIIVPAIKKKFNELGDLVDQNLKKRFNHISQILDYTNLLEDQFDVVYDLIEIGQHNGSQENLLNDLLKSYKGSKKIFQKGYCQTFSDDGKIFEVENIHNAKEMPFYIVTIFDSKNSSYSVCSLNMVTRDIKYNSTVDETKLPKLWKKLMPETYEEPKKPIWDYN